MKKLFVDLETYSEANLTKYGHVAYAKHPSTEILVVAYALDDEAVTSFCPLKENKTPAELKLLGMLKDDADLCVNIIAHNAQFEYSIFKHVATARMDWPELSISKFIDSMALAATLNIPTSLAALTHYLMLPTQKDTAGKALIKLFCSPDKDGQRTLMTDNPIDSAEFMKYCRTDVESMRQAYNKMPLKELSPIEQEAWELDCTINETGVPVDIKLVTACAELVKERVEQKTAIFKDKFGFNPTQNKKLIEYLATQGVEVENTQKTTLEELKDLPSDAKEAVGIRLAISKASVKKFSVMRDAAIDGRIYGCFKFQAASTGRWAGKIVQFQNLARTVYNPDIIERAVYEGLHTLVDKYKNSLAALSSLLRHVIQSDVGLCAIDFSSIEARVLAWIAGQEDILQVFRDGGDIYEHAAAKIFNIPTDKVKHDQRFVGKVATLALGYQGGAKAFQRMSKAFKVDISKEQAETIKLEWREANDKIVSLWKHVEKAAMKVVRSRKTIKIGKLEFGTYKNWLYIKLPSGRTINYVSPQIVRAEAPWGETVDKLTYYGQQSGTKQWGRIDTYGGKLVENICQAIARDLLRDAMLRLNGAGYDIVMHVHDSVVIECYDELAIIKRLFTYSNAEYAGLPIHAEGYFSNNYRK